MEKDRLFKIKRGLALCGSLLMLYAAQGHAFYFNQGDLKGAFDTDITYGASARTENPDAGNLGSYGNRVFNDKGDIFSNSIRGSSTLSLDYKNVGMLVRGNYFYDFQYADQKSVV